MTSAASCVFRALAVVREVLVPCGLKERTDNNAVVSVLFNKTVFCYRYPFSNDVFSGFEIVFSNILNLFAEAVECEIETVSDVVRVEASGCGIS